MHINTKSKGDSLQRCPLGKYRHFFPASMRRRSRYTPGGANRNCGWFGISPKSFFGARPGEFHGDRNPVRYGPPSAEEIHLLTAPFRERDAQIAARREAELKAELAAARKPPRRRVRNDLAAAALSAGAA